jgi:hypothetical protein
MRFLLLLMVFSVIGGNVGTVRVNNIGEEAFFEIVHFDSMLRAAGATVPGNQFPGKLPAQKLTISDQPAIKELRRFFVLAKQKQQITPQQFLAFADRLKNCHKMTYFTYTGLGDALEKTQKGAAMQAYRQAILIEPGLLQAWWRLVKLTEQTRGKQWANVVKNEYKSRFKKDLEPEPYPDME